jgi:DNA-binding transcriptional regulator LsrR (DeoR family)
MGNRRPASPETERLYAKEARARIEAGETQRSVARSYSVSQTTISRLRAQVSEIAGCEFQAPQKGLKLIKV